MITGQSTTQSQILTGFAHSEGPPLTQCNIITFLATVQNLRVPILPVTWQTIAGIKGGATSQISQAAMNLETSFAFKRIKNEGMLDRDRIDDEKCFRWLINELMVLWHPAIRGHVNILELQGLTWDIRLRHDEANKGEVSVQTPGKYKVWPVFVFEKSQHGNLEEFARSRTGRGLSTADRSKICFEIANAVAHMHSYDIVHGDIKPSNILVFGNKDSVFFAKLADFSHSAWASNDEDTIKLHGTRPWTAPELRADGHRFSLSEAKKTDLFSLGMLCLWFIFEKHFSTEFQAPMNKDSYGDIDDPFAPIAYLKRKGSLAEFARQLVEEAALLPEQRDKLRHFFSRALALNPTSRSNSLKELLEQIVEDRAPETVTSAEYQSYPANEDDFKLRAHLNALYSADFRLRSFIVNELESIVRENPKTPLAIQLGLCHELNFGNPVSERRTDFECYLRDTLVAAFDEAEDYELPSLELHSGSLYGYLERKGLAAKISVSDIYQELNILEEAEEFTQSEIEGAMSFLGDDNPTLIVLKSTLSNIKLHRNKVGEALLLMEEAMDLCRLSYGEGNETTSSIKSHLASVYASHGRLEDARRLIVEVMDSTKRKHEAPYLEHGDHLIYEANLAAIYQEKKQYRRAEALFHKVLTAAKRLWPPSHPVFLSLRTDLASSYFEQGKYQLAEEIMVEVVDTQKTSAREHPQTLESMSFLSRIYARQHKWNEADAHQQEIVDIRESVLGAGHSLTLEAMSGMAELYNGREDHDNVLAWRLKILSLVGTDHPLKQTAELNLADTYRSMERWDEAETIQELALEKTKATHGLEHPETRKCAAELFHTYICQNRRPEAMAITPAPNPKANAKLEQDEESMRNRTPQQEQASRDRERRALARRKRIYGSEGPRPFMDIDLMHGIASDNLLETSILGEQRRRGQGKRGGRR